MAALEVLAFPEHRAAGSVEAGGAQTAEVHVKAPGFRKGGRSRIRIHGGAVPERFWIVDLEDFRLQGDRARFCGHPNGVELVSVVRGGGKPDLAVQNDGAGYAVERDLGL